MQLRKRIRFVGGGWHNRIEFVWWDPYLFVRSPGTSACDPIDVYELTELETERGTVFWEYHRVRHILAQIAA